MELFEDGELIGEQYHRVDPFEDTGYQTIPAKDKSTKIWKRFSLLPNVEGQKYTIGNTFTSREEQGELIFWSEVEKTKIIPNYMCEISVVKNEYWITPLMENKIFVNDVEIKASTQIKFGDRISFGAERKYWAKIWEKEPSPVQLLFKKREFLPQIVSPCLPESPGRSQWDNDSSTSFGQNSLLVSLLLSYIPVQNLKEFRFVSKRWNEEASKLVKKEYQVNFNFAEGDDAFDESNKSMKLFQYSVDMKNCLLQNWVITLPTSKPRRCKKCLTYSGAKLLADLEWFLLPQNLGHSIRRLELGGNIVYAKDMDVRAKILENLAPTLQDLVLSGVWNSYHCPSEGIASPIINFKQLEGFTLNSGMDGVELSPHDRIWLQFVLQSIQGVGTLRFDRWDIAATLFLQKQDYFHNLEEVVFNYTTPTVITLLLSLEKPLKKIELCRIQKLEDMENFEKLLQFYSNTLESLVFDVPQCYDKDRVVLPAMPKLKRLTIGVLNGNSDYGIYFRLYEEVATLAFSEGGHLNYSQHLPALESLTLSDVFGRVGYCKPISEMDKFWEENEQFYDAFFPQDPQICETLRYLDIPFEDVNHHVFPRAGQVAAMFPNVSNPWINEVRKKNEGSAE